MENDYVSLLKGVLSQFAIYGEFESAEAFGSGHINNTYRSQWNQAGVRVRYTHQRINEKVFVRPDEVMENIERVTRHIMDKLVREGAADRSRRVLSVVPSREGKPWVRDSGGSWWRTYLFIEGTHTLEVAKSPGDARFLGKSIGRFQKQLADLGEPRLHETIPDFHNMEKRYSRFYDALARDPYSRVKDAAAEIAFMRENEGRGSILIRALKDGSIPERICHNDTKMNNILIDDDPETSGKSPVSCVVDLDTVMPGTSLFDVGDLIRTVTTRAEEDERDLSKVAFDIDLFEALLDGYLSEAAQFLSPEENALIAESGRNITQIMGLRFLTDYLEGDHYYHTARAGHNLDRCRNQIALIRSMDGRWERVGELTGAICERNGSNMVPHSEP
ncbi:MAG: aminoglycoside phosphotransferase family protein [Treponema sp.]|jgi:Ser/Thr protein kinase RdoA (MazF antagonist)|nr:aminoglycoside phosphotransferase family protein [Treponema sp.]